MPRIDDLIDKVGKAKFLTKIDLSKCYWQVPLEEKAVPISAFVTPFCHFQWKYMPFGYKNFTPFGYGVMLAKNNV